MKKILLLFIAFLALSTHADTDVVVLTPTGPGHNRSEVPMSVYYDSDNQVIIIDGDGTISYYDVEISSASTGYVEISTVVNGTYDTIDVSSLSAGTHVITIESPTGNIYEGTFTTY